MIETRYDRKRGCGYRSPGGLYFVSSGISRSCGRLPIPLDRCPTCGHGIKFSRGFTWIDIAALLADASDSCRETAELCATCPMGALEGRHGLIWIGEKFYKTPAHWVRETEQQGASRRVSAVPKDFKLGETWILVAHRKVPLRVPREDDDGLSSAIFHAFKPDAIEYVVKDDDSDEKLERLVKRGITPVRIEIVKEPELFEDAS